MTTTWEGILDPSDHPKRVWFSKRKDSDDPWIPLRKCDCEALNVAYQLQNDGNQNENTNNEDQQLVLIEFGRATADLRNNVIRNNFYNVPLRELTSAVWYKVDTSSSSGSSNTSGNHSNSNIATVVNEDGTLSGGNEIRHFIPITSFADESIIESLYQEAVSAQEGRVGSKGKYALDYVLKKEMELQEDSNYKVYIVKSNNGVLRMRKKQKSLISLLEGYTELQRGYGSYLVEGEEEECSLGPVRHLSFLVHGIGEALWSREEVSTASLIDEVNHIRTTINKKLYHSWKVECEKVKRANFVQKNNASMPMPSPPNRIEFIPIEWYDQIHSSSSTLKNDLNSTTLTTVPKLRRIANDVIFDVLVYNTPEFCGKVLDCVTTQICDLYDGFQKVHPDFVSGGGKCSIVGHSLGSVITWDLLSILSDNIDSDKCKMYEKQADDQKLNVQGYKLPSRMSTEAQAYEAYITQTESNIDAASVGTWGPTMLNKMTKTIPFVPSFTFFLGSPIGLFLTLRGARPHFDQMSNDTKQPSRGEKKGSSNDEFIMVEAEYHKASPFHLPSGSVYNIFSPSDPVAYRIEPLLLPSNYPEELPSPCFLAPGGKGLRFHVKAKEIGDNIMKSFSGLINTSLNKIPEKLPSIKDNLSDTIEAAVSSGSKQKSFRKGELKWKFPLGGQSDRVDYQLQPGVIDNEYLAAISAHNSYMRNDDLLEFWIECALRAN